MILIERCDLINQLFNDVSDVNCRYDKEYYINTFKSKYPELVSDLNYCFEVLAGKHKLGYTYLYSKYVDVNLKPVTEQYINFTIQEFIEMLKQLSGSNASAEALLRTPSQCRQFICYLVNRDFKLGYSNKEAMITHYSPMLAKKYQDTYKAEQLYYIQEKLDGNRCIAAYDFDKEQWEFWSRSGKRLKVNFNMSWAATSFVYDGEIMTLEHAGSRDFNRTSGAINGKYTDKSQLHYFIYDIVAPSLMYKDRKAILDKFTDTGTDCSILPVLDEVVVYPNHDYNWRLDEWLDKITDKGGEGIMLRDPYSYYTPGKRSDGLLKYKKTQTMDLRIIDWNEGNGKYLGAVGSWKCATDDNDIIVNVSGMSDDLHYISDPSIMINKIVEVAYFDISVNSATGQKSLRFPRLKKIRDDKNETSTY